MRKTTFYQPKTLKDALLPTTIIYWIVGLGVIEYPVGYPRKILGFLYSSTICTIYGVAIYLSHDLVEMSSRTFGSPIGSFGHSITVWLNYTSLFVVIFASIKLNKKRNACIAELIDIDGALIRMGVACSYQTFFIRQIVHLFIPFLVILFNSAIELVNLTQYYWIFGWLKVNSGFYQNTFPICVLTVGDITFCAFTRSLWIRENFTLGIFSHFLEACGLFRIVNASTVWPIMSTNYRVMTQYFKDLNSLLKSMKGNSSDDYNATVGNLIQVEPATSDKQKLQKLRCIRTIHSRLVRVARCWTELNKVSIIASVVICLCKLVLLARTVYSMLHNPEQTTNNAMIITCSCLWIVFWMGKSFNVVHSAAALTFEAQKTCEILLRFLHPIAFIRVETHAFALQLIQNPLHLSADGLFDLDNSLLQMIISTVCTYLIVLIQTQNA